MNGDKTFRRKFEQADSGVDSLRHGDCHESGEVHFFDDIYGLDANCSRRLAQGYPYTKDEGIPNSRPRTDFWRTFAKWTYQRRIGPRSTCTNCD